jgi:hypothetical protein
MVKVVLTTGRVAIGAVEGPLTELAVAARLAAFALEIVAEVVARQRVFRVMRAGPPHGRVMKIVFVSGHVSVLTNNPLRLQGTEAVGDTALLG